MTAGAGGRAARLQVRTAGEADRAFLVQLYVATRAAEVAALGWTDDQVRAVMGSQYDLRERAYRARYPADAFMVVERDGEPVGSAVVAAGSAGVGEVRLVDIAVADAARGEGIASALISSLVEESARVGVDVVLEVVSGNEARRLYERLGFSVDPIAGDGGGRVTMRAPAGRSPCGNPAAAIAAWRTRWAAPPVHHM